MSLDYARWIWLIFYGTLIVGIMVTVLMENRQPAKTLAWLLVLTFLPVVGLVLYAFFGRDHRKKRIHRANPREPIPLKPISPPQAQASGDRHDIQPAEAIGSTSLVKGMEDELTIPLIRLFANQGMEPPFHTDHTELYVSGYEFFPALLHAIGKARRTITLSTYIIADDPLGRLVVDALADKAAEGVDVSLVYDDVGCWKVHNSFFRRISRRGIRVEAFMPVHFPALTGKINYRNHRKICVIDGDTVFIGGMNVALRYVKEWRDTHLCVHRSTEGALAQFVTSSPLSPWPDIMQAYVRILLEARHYVWMETPYFLPTEPILFAMRTAALAGVDVRLMVPRHSDAILAEWASISYVSQAIEAGVQVWLYQDGFNHSKLLVSDDSISTCGSTNIDFRSFENNFEANIFFYDKEMAQRIRQVFLDDMSRCTLANDHWQANGRRPFVRRLWESVVRLLSPLL